MFFHGKQEVRAADDNVVVPADLHLPQEAELQKYAAHMLGLSFPFSPCEGPHTCGSHSWRCFACHDLEANEKDGKIYCRFQPLWRHWRACLALRFAAAQERILAGLSPASAPFIRDVVTVRAYVHVSPAAEDAVTLADLKLLLHRCLRPRDCRFHDVVRIWELLAWHLGVHFDAHYTQLSPLEFVACIQTGWNERFEQHHAARRLSSSRRRAERFALMTKIEEDDLEDDTAPPDIEGDDVEDDLRQQEELERLERAQWTLEPHSLQQALFREEEWEKILKNPRSSVLRDTLQMLHEFVNALGGVPKVANGMGIRGASATGIERNWTAAEAEHAMSRQKQYLEFCAGGSKKSSMGHTQFASISDVFIRCCHFETSLCWVWFRLICIAFMSVCAVVLSCHALGF